MVSSGSSLQWTGQEEWYRTTRVQTLEPESIECVSGEGLICTWLWTYLLKAEAKHVPPHLWCILIPSIANPLHSVPFYDIEQNAPWLFTTVCRQFFLSNKEPRKMITVHAHDQPFSNNNWCTHQAMVLPKAIHYRRKPAQSSYSTYY